MIEEKKRRKSEDWLDELLMILSLPDWSKMQTYPKFYKRKHLTHKEGIKVWINKLRLENPDKKYYIMEKAPIPDALELDLKSGEITALEYETTDGGVLDKKKFYEKLGSDFDRVILISENSEENFIPSKPNHISIYGNIVWKKRTIKKNMVNG